MGLLKNSIGVSCIGAEEGTRVSGFKKGFEKGFNFSVGAFLFLLFLRIAFLGVAFFLGAAFLGAAFLGVVFLGIAFFLGVVFFLDKLVIDSSPLDSIRVRFFFVGRVEVRIS